MKLQKQIAPLALTSMLFLALFSCSNTAPEPWKNPTTDEQLAQLETKSLGEGLAKDRRAQLLFLYGQELAAKGKQDPSKTELTVRAMGAFERIIDLNAVLVAESRFNVEILSRELEKNEQKDQQDNKDQKDSKDKQDQKDQQSGDDKQEQKKDGEQKDAQQKDGKEQQGKQGQQGEQKEQQGKDQKDQASEPKDMSALVKELEQKSEADKALKQEQERKAQKQKIQAGTIVPVEKDW
jgi:hypothetical protein